MTDPSGETVVDIARLRRSCGACALSQLCLPATIGHEDMPKLEAAVRQHRPLDAGRTLFAEGSPFNELHVVRSGSLKTVSVQSDGTEQVLGFHLPGDVVGLDAVAEGQHRCTAMTLERTTVCDIPFNAIEDVARRVPGLQRQLYRVISREFVRDQEHLATMGRKQAPERLAIFLKSLSDRRRALGLEPLELTLSMSRSDIGNYLGLVIETVSRLFSRFQDEGLLTVQRRALRILDYDALARLAAGMNDATEGSRQRSPLR
ncbi:fumarate/nitrate reduction transcriptional regulator Fnr [Oleiagrimonas sp. C23AA]|uniref:fumarate/nitrate reduction transcriptional regulator Fnr n=1 Tax=Oleiagrimonas sp. C23AA TaxID=2719047 RepID=UPI00142191B3|nr:fumarate/nitrate reduction transcriptional regulator Fnr [Oleiagrimonas sp. C23AA]NII09741.1 fumarate/nitrate reduction transcriptional regulator Fnr [Oleiagrimonas sp. C23AA]